MKHGARKERSRASQVVARDLRCDTEEEAGGSGLDAGLWSGSEQIGAEQEQPGRLHSWFQYFSIVR